MPGPKKQLSLDANFVFDLAAQKEFAHDFLEAFQKKGYALALFARPSGSPEALAARIALSPSEIGVL